MSLGDRLAAPFIGSGVYAHAEALAGTCCNNVYCHGPGTDLKLAILPRRAKNKDLQQEDVDMEDPTSFDITINRAELVAIKAALGAGYTHIATDSLASIHQVELPTGLELADPPTREAWHGTDGQGMGAGPSHQLATTHTAYLVDPFVVHGLLTLYSRERLSFMFMGSQAKVEHLKQQQLQLRDQLQHHSSLPPKLRRSGGRRQRTRRRRQAACPSTTSSQEELQEVTSEDQVEMPIGGCSPPTQAGGSNGEGRQQRGPEAHSEVQVPPSLAASNHGVDNFGCSDFEWEEELWLQEAGGAPDYDSSSADYDLSLVEYEAATLDLSDSY
eukprot:gene1800-biopygen3242